jgi:hypothetical protein
MLPKDWRSRKKNDRSYPVDRDLKEAEHATSDDWKFGIAYNAALKLCAILLNASGYRPDRLQAHFRTLQSLPLILGAELRTRRTTETVG